MFCVFVITSRVPATHGSQKRELDSLEFIVTNSYQLPHECWELNPELLQEQPVLLTTEPSLQPHETWSIFSTFPRQETVI